MFVPRESPINIGFCLSLCLFDPFVFAIHAGDTMARGFPLFARVSSWFNKQSKLMQSPL